MGFADFPFTSRYLTVDGEQMHYIDEGKGPALLFLHGNPTSSYLWRNVIKALAPRYRCIAPDLMGFGKSAKPDCDYRFATHYRYLSGFIDALSLDDVTVIGHDWGGVLAFQLAQQSPEIFTRLCFMETFPFTFDWGEFPLPVRPLFFAFRRPRLGELLLIRQNLFLNLVLPSSVIRHLPRSVMQTYKAPFKHKKDRKPIRVWPSELPINDDQGETWQAIRQIEENLPAMPQPKLLLQFQPGAVLGKTRIEWLKQRLSKLTVTHCGLGLHYVQEDQPERIAKAVDDWLQPLAQSAAAAASPSTAAKVVREDQHYERALSWYWGHTPWGQMLAAWSGAGLVYLQFAESADAGLAALEAQFPQCQLDKGTAEDFNNCLKRPSPALHLIGTDFQRTIWKALLEIPAGTTTTYNGLARQAGSHARAVGQAVGKNNLAILVPCHRVLKSDGGLGGYRWGIERKQALLASEANAPC